MATAGPVTVRTRDPIEEHAIVAKRQQSAQTRFGRTAVRSFAVNHRLSQMLIEQLDPAVWKAKPPGKVRSIAAIFAHVHNVRCKWIRLTAPHLKVPLLLKHTRCTPRQASKAFTQSGARCAEMLAEALDGDDGRVKKFLRDGWARPWPVGPEMLCYIISHEAHHRGQVCMIAHQLGFPLSNTVTSEMWNWEKLWKECGAHRGPGYDS
ncbi:MAG: DinB family protein [Terracidiphilus sp.]